MKLLPLLGLDDVRFGMGVENVLACLGEPLARREYRSFEQKLSLRYPAITLGFDGSGRLNFIVVDAAAGRVSLWEEDPFEIAAQGPDPLEEIRGWLQRSGRQLQPVRDGFASTASVPDQGVTFCFDGPDALRLEGIQLYP